MPSESELPDTPNGGKCNYQPAVRPVWYSYRALHELTPKR